MGAVEFKKYITYVPSHPICGVTYTLNYLKKIVFEQIILNDSSDHKF